MPKMPKPCYLKTICITVDDEIVYRGEPVDINCNQKISAFKKMLGAKYEGTVVELVVSRSPIREERDDPMHRVKLDSQIDAGMTVNSAAWPGGNGEILYVEIVSKKKMKRVDIDGWFSLKYVRNSLYDVTKMIARNKEELKELQNDLAEAKAKKKVSKKEIKDIMDSIEYDEDFAKRLDLKESSLKATIQRMEAELIDESKRRKTRKNRRS